MPILKTHSALNDFRTDQGFENLYDQFAKRLFAICFSRIRNREDAEEIVHDIFRSVWERRENIYDEAGSIEKYLVRAVKLKTVDYFRKQANEPVMLKDVDMIVGYGNFVEEEYNLYELQARVGHLVDELPPTCQKVYRLSRQNGMSNKEIATSLSISEKTVESHMTKALAHLRQHLKEYALTSIFLLGLI